MTEQNPRAKKLRSARLPSQGFREAIHLESRPTDKRKKNYPYSRLLQQSCEINLYEMKGPNDLWISFLFPLQGMPVRSLAVKDETISSNTKQRSKSEVRRPAFYFPDELTKTNAYTCL